MVDWPALTYEPRQWVSTINPGNLTVYERMRIEKPYQAAVPPKIAKLNIELKDDIKAIVEAATYEIARFDAQMAMLPVPMPTILLRSESASSSQIEHLTTNARNLALATIGIDAKQNAQLVAANVRAMQLATAAADRQLSAESLLSVHRALLEQFEPEIAGRWRKEQVWIGSHAAYPHGADYVAPHFDRVPPAINDLVKFAARDDLPALIQAAIAHAQFETIHPFTDGNGRTGRVLIQSVLRQRGLITATTIPISAGLLLDPQKYFGSLTAYRKGDPNPIVAAVAQAALSAISNGKQLAEDIGGIREAWGQQITARAGSSAWPLADLLVTQPVITAAHVAERLSISDRTARNAIETLVADKVLAPASSAKRMQYWQAPEIQNAMDAFAKRAGRRHHG